MWTSASRRESGHCSRSVTSTRLKRIPVPKREREMSIEVETKVSKYKPESTDICCYIGIP